MRRTLSLLLSFLLPVLAVAQAPVANFAANVTSGCGPLTVTFTDQSTGSPTAWNWDFGTSLAQGQGPKSITFNSPGVFSVTLTVRNANGINSVTKTNYITVYASPQVGFTADKTLTCLPDTIHFKDNSIANAPSIVQYHWDFGDPSTFADTSNQKDPVYIYTKPGFYDVYLSVVSSTGCYAAGNVARYIRIVNGVKADFSTAGPSTCSPPYNIKFNNLTSGPGNLTYAWDLGNASTSTQVSPTGTYAGAGNYTVKLTAQSDFGCSDVIQKVIPVKGATASFTAPTRVCLGSPATFQVTSSPAPVSVFWNFGDGTTSTQLAPPPKTYANPGTYTVTLRSNFSSCTDSVTKTIVVGAKPTVDFYAADNNSGCKPPHPVNFQNLSPNAVSSLWNFGDNTTSPSNSPVHTYTTGGNFDVSLTITDSNGCTNTIKKTNYVNILAPVVLITGQPGVCVGQAYKPSFSGGTVDGIASYAWNFGDGSPVDNAANPSHSFAAAGNYTVKLTIITNGGCTASGTIGLQVGTPPAINFSADKTQPCHSDLVKFTNLSVPAGNSFVWNFGDGSTSVLASPPPHKFADSGFYSITLSVTSNGCTDSATKSNYIHLVPPVANFGYTADCVQKTNVVFSDSTINADPPYGPLSYQWNFGDGSPVSTVLNPPHTFPALGSYNVQLIAKNAVCTDTIIKPVRLLNTKSDFTFDKPVYCRKDQVHLFYPNDFTAIKTYNWIIDGVATLIPDGNFFITYDSSGTHTARLVTKDINGCYDTSALKSFTVTGPRAKFSIANRGGCNNSSINFIDSSSSSGTLTKWVFDFGDGTAPQTFLAPPFTHKYANPGNYDVTLTVFDNTSGNCSDTYTLSGANGAIINRPKPGFGVDTAIYCPNTPLQFRDSSSSGIVSYNWNFGDGSTATGPNPMHAYSGKDSSYSVTLIVIDSIGCTDSLTRAGYIKIRSPKPFFGVKDTATLCPPLETTFYFKGQDYQSYYWNFGDGSTFSQPVEDSAKHFYNAYGIYTAKLVVTGFGGCQDSASTTIHVTNPFTATSISFDPKTACNELTVNFSVLPPVATRFQLFFGDGAVDTTQQPSIQHLYNFPSVYAPYLVLTDSVGCLIVYGGLGFVDIKGAVPLFGMDKKKFCDSGQVYFTDYSQDANDKIVTRNWDFGDGFTTVLTGDTVHTYTKPGLYIPKLTVTTQYPCTQTFTDTVRVLATPQPVIGSVDGICNNLIVDFTGSLLVPPDTAITWKWDLGKGVISNKQNVSVNYPDTGLHHITLEATNSLGCKGDTAKDIRVFPLPTITVSGDTSIISGGVGTIIPLTYSANATVFNWSPATNLSCTDCANPFANPKFTTTYNVKVTDANGCVSNRNITLIVVCNNKNFFIPNTFSPNNDGTNDRFYPRGTGLDRIQALRIFNRWGELVFEKRNFPANDPASGWDGTYKGKPGVTDTYIYMIDIICENANIITYKGNVTLIR